MNKAQNASQNPQEPAEGSPPPKAPPPPPRLALLKWHAQKGTKRDLLAIGATARCYDPAQEENTLSEVELTEAEFDQLVADAREIHTKALKEGGGRAHAVKVLVHETLLIAVIVKRPNQAVADKLIRDIADPDLSSDETLAQVRMAFTDSLLWPKMGSEPFAVIMEATPIAFGHTFPGMLLATLGKDSSGAKKVG